MTQITVMDIGQFSWQEGTPNLLQALEDAGLDISFSCRSGACGSCRLNLVAGRVNWVKSPVVSLEKGDILACCVTPNGDISIQLPD